ncbi:helix-turn-helix domain-containing protein [Halomicrobium sp. LC1Hm]|uniref:winged helix-turn-helix transcriptional regulator n=1 Tax=Halomicrobium sp. LC1Hm TaxID=2610902 RepID=UPI0012982D11|nr:helix-turn-helix domain-containing protein [Halomicrobium sp. LC1Hm]QGA84086.1 DNA-binding transcriptional regulator, HxlR family [Halomicrobium sp. LC1Hm]
MSSDARTLSWNESGAVDQPYFVDIDEVFNNVTDILGRKWHLRIVYYLLDDGPMGFSALKDRLDGVSSKMLSESLSSLEAYDIVVREIVSDQPVRVEYSLSEKGAALAPLLDDIVQWNSNYDQESTEER